MNEIKYEDLPRNAAVPVTGAMPEVEHNPFDEIAAAVDSKPLVFRAIDYIRPDWALFRGIKAQQERRAGRTDWKPTPRTPRTPGKYRTKALAGRYHRPHFV